MKLSSVLLPTLLFLFAPVCSFDPDAEIVQDPSKVVEEERGKSAPLPSASGRSSRATEVIRVMRPFNISGGVIYREAGLSNLEISDILRTRVQRQPPLSSDRGSSQGDGNDRNRPFLPRNGGVAPSPGGQRERRQTPEGGYRPQRPSSGDRGGPSISDLYLPYDIQSSGAGGQYARRQTPEGGYRPQRPSIGDRGGPSNSDRYLPYDIQSSGAGGQDARRQTPEGGYRPQRPSSGDRGGPSDSDRYPPINRYPPMPPSLGGQNPSAVQPSYNGQNRGNAGNGRNPNRDAFSGTNNGGSRVPQGGPTKASPDSNLFAGMVNDFAFKLTEQMSPQLEGFNFIVSPMSLFVIMSMLYMGSEGQTKGQLEEALGLNENSVHGERLHQGIRDLLNLVSNSKTSAQHQINVANGMFLGRNFTANRQFIEDVRRYYDAELQNLDFSDPDLSVRVINNWVSRSTSNTIPDLIDRPPPLLTRLLIINVAYFKGTWKMQFPRDLTYRGSFHAFDGSTKEVPTMALSNETFSLYRSDEQGHNFIKLPYAGDEVSLVIALPQDPADKRPMPSIRDRELYHILESLKDTRLDRVAIPKFRLEETFFLKRPLLEMGIRDIFNLGTVDLSKLRQENDVYVTAILHKAIMEVNEEGTTASAITGLRVEPLTPSNKFVVNRPFAFYLMHEPSGLVLFYGKVYDLGGSSATQ